MAIGDYLPRRRREGSYSNEGSFLPISRKLESIFDDFLPLFSDMWPTRMMTSFMPRLNVTENDQEIKVVAELPGMSEQDVDITLTRDALVLKGEKREERKEDERNRFYEFSYGTFERYIPLYTEVKEDEVKASFDKGLLTITLPKTEKARAQMKRIPIQGDGKRKSVGSESGGMDRGQRQNGRSGNGRGVQDESQQVSR